MKRPMSVALLVLAAALLGLTWMLAAGYNDAAVLTLIGAVACVLLALPRHRLQAALVIVFVICCVGIWATLGGGADPLTAIPWGLVAVAAIGGVVIASRRAHRGYRREV